jgi:hypothetical protein
MTVGYFRFAKGIDLRPHLAGLPGDMCQYPHWGYLLEGTLLMHTPSEDLDSRSTLVTVHGQLPDNKHYRITGTCRLYTLERSQR